jgi:hypothetical protein
LALDGGMLVETAEPDEAEDQVSVVPRRIAASR